MQKLTTARNVPTEMTEQVMLMKWIKLAQPKIKSYVVKLNNEGRRTPAQGWQLKRQGMCVGASDLFLAYPVTRQDGDMYYGCWLELKRARKYCDSERETGTWVGQVAFQRDMRTMGYACAFCYGWEMASEVIMRYLAGEIIGEVDPLNCV